MLAKVTQAAVTQDITFADTIAAGHGNASYCGPRTYTLSPSINVLTISGSTMTLASTSPADVATSQITLTVKLVDYPMVTELSKTFTTVI